MNVKRTAVAYTLILILLAVVGTLYLNEKPITPITSVEAVTKRTDEGFGRIFNDELKHELHIYITEEEWLGMGKDMMRYRYTDSRMRTGAYRTARVVYKDDYGEFEIDRIGIRTKGNTTRLIPENHEGVLRRSHFKLKFDWTLDERVASEAYKQLGQRTFLGVNELALKSNMESDRSFVHEKYAYDLLRQLGVPAPKITLTTLTVHVDGRELDYGVYTVIESVNKGFLTNQYGTKLNDGNLYRALWQDFGPATLMPIINPMAVGIKDWESNYRPAYDLITNTDSVTHVELYDFIDHLNRLEGEAFVDYIDKTLDVDVLLKAFAVTVLIGSPDDYRAMGNNYYLYFKPDGQVVFFPYDFDNSLGYGWDGESFGGYEGIATEDIYEWRSLASIFMGVDYSHPLADKILAVEKYRGRYEEILLELISTKAYSYESFLKLFESVKVMYGDDLDNVTSAGKLMFLTNEKSFMDLKIKSVLDQIEK
ncbi:MULTISPECIES: CotH kinase family protein [unclassified Fusibacter]|uniref:CotH kinase family protein n=1 Tax=unclassified Fusibacter TaxID=2624464 RepID=UPI0010109F79|nr:MULTISPECIES: CotH kinase family protein [unclassified Fusibacter]MCK8061650.1 CotH kinase family protein [Fusibacter sp. A2]NPE23834.1 hypothetical protein [Fusibacter sp. A1]RXV58607.1 hypothetical protein DWB64_18785 [Fusibacter sp. A1]